MTISDEFAGDISEADPRHVGHGRQRPKRQAEKTNRTKMRIRLR